MNNWTIYGGYEVCGLTYFDTALEGEMNGKINVCRSSGTSCPSIQDGHYW